MRRVNKSKMGWQQKESRTGPYKRLIVASPRGFCAGVRHAVEIAEVALRVFPRPVYCLKEIVHNPHVVNGLREKGMVFVQSVREVPEGAVLVISAHGVAPTVLADAAARHLRVIDATCPFVRKVHTEVRRYATAGFTILLIGYADHDEVIGVAGEAPEHVIVVENAESASRVCVPDRDRVAVVTQTTLSSDQTEQILSILRRRFPNLVTPSESDICYATTNRQEAVKRLARLVPAIVVLGAENSSNTHRLVEVAKASGVDAFLVSNTAHLQELPLEKYDTIGLTAGASTPEAFIETALDTLAGLGFQDIEHMTLVDEAVHFALPKTLRDRLRELRYSLPADE